MQANSKQSHAELRTKQRVYEAKYRRNNRRKAYLSNLAWRRRNAELVRSYYWKHRDRYLEYQRNYRLSHRSEASIYWQSYYLQHRDKWKTDPVQIAKLRSKHSRSRAIRKGALVNDDYVGSLIRGWLRAKTFTCFYCRKRYPIAKMHVDHILPVSRGGKHTVSNVCRACSSCNLAKHNKTVDEWVRARRKPLHIS